METLHVKEAHHIKKIKKAKTILRNMEQNLARVKIALKRKTIALEEVLTHIDRAQDTLKDELAANIQRKIMPVLRRLSLKPGLKVPIALLQGNLEEIASKFGRRLFKIHVELSPKEMEVCRLVEDGLTNKEISVLNSVAIQTIEKHRKNIRKKLGLTSKKINLSSYLRSI